MSPERASGRGRLAQCVGYWRDSWVWRLGAMPSGFGPDDTQAVRELAALYAALRRAPERERPAVSVVAPTHVGEDHALFTRLLLSLVRGKDSPATEIIIVLNGKVSMRELERSPLLATSRSVGVRTALISYSDEPRYASLVRPQTHTVPRQKGLEMALGEVVVFVDVDCICHPGLLRAYADAFAASEETLGAYGGVYGLQVARGVGPWLVTRASSFFKGLKILAGFPPYAGHNQAVRASILKAVPDFQLRVEGDCHELAGVLARHAPHAAPIHRAVAFIPGAQVATPFPPSKRSLAGAFSWLAESTLRNVRNYLRFRRNMR